MNISWMWARAAVNVALKVGGTHKQVSQYLTRAAELDPSALTEKIAELRGQIKLLESYLPAGK
jgi:hypothetical protein